MIIGLLIGIVLGIALGIGYSLIKKHFSHKKIRKVSYREGYKRLSLEIPEYIHVEFKLLAARLQCTMTDIVIDLIVQELLYHRQLGFQKVNIIAGKE